MKNAELLFSVCSSLSFYLRRHQSCLLVYSYQFNVYKAFGARSHFAKVTQKTAAETTVMPRGKSDLREFFFISMDGFVCVSQVTTKRCPMCVRTQAICHMDHIIHVADRLAIHNTCGGQVGYGHTWGAFSLYMLWYIRMVHFQPAFFRNQNKFSIISSIALKKRYRNTAK